MTGGNCSKVKPLLYGAPFCRKFNCLSSLASTRTGFRFETTSSPIDSDDLLPTIEKLHYLRFCVQGQAATMIQNLPATEASYARAWKKLSDFYSNTQLLVRAYLNKFLALP